MILLKYRMYIVFLMKQALKADNDGWTPRESKNEAIVLEKVSVFFFCIKNTCIVFFHVIWR
jgi:hypothetical protein